jgi:tetratricopeptide (TPR) repeat protein
MQGCGPCAGSSSGSGNSAPSYDYGAAQRAQQAAADAEAERLRQAKAERIERERKEEEKRQKDAAFIRDRDAAANSLKGSSGSAMSQLKGLTGADNSGLKGSGFDTGNAGLKGLQGSNSVVDDRNEPAGLGGKSNFKGAITKPSKPAPHTDTSVVDARVPRDGTYLTDQIPELKNSPAADRITKGFQAVINHDWPVALAWWQDALNRDPNNAALKRSVELAQWMVDRPKAKAAVPVTHLGAAIYSASHGDSAKAIGQFEQIKKENPDIAPQIDDMISALKKRQAKDAKASYWNRVIKEDTQKMVDEMFETGMNRLSVGDEKGAQESFNDATFFGGMGNVRPSQLPALKSKSGNTK